jgi:hypothetical protein
MEAQAWETLTLSLLTVMHSERTATKRAARSTSVEYSVAHIDGPAHLLTPLVRPVIDGMPYPGMRDCECCLQRSVRAPHPLSADCRVFPCKVLIKHQDTLDIEAVWLAVMDYSQLHEGVRGRCSCHCKTPWHRADAASADSRRTSSRHACGRCTFPSLCASRAFFVACAKRGRAGCCSLCVVADYLRCRARPSHRQLLDEQTLANSNKWCVVPHTHPQELNTRGGLPG